MRLGPDSDVEARGLEAVQWGSAKESLFFDGSAEIRALLASTSSLAGVGVGEP
jgi:hypothetical protein